jgi:hypothetical protein
MATDVRFMHDQSHCLVSCTYYNALAARCLKHLPNLREKVLAENTQIKVTVIMGPLHVDPLGID